MVLVCFERFSRSLVGWPIFRGLGTGFGHMADGSKPLSALAALFGFSIDFFVVNVLLA